MERKSQSSSENQNDEKKRKIFVFSRFALRIWSVKTKIWKEYLSICSSITSTLTAAFAGPNFTNSKIHKFLNKFLSNEFSKNRLVLELIEFFIFPKIRIRREQIKTGIPQSFDEQNEKKHFEPEQKEDFYSTNISVEQIFYVEMDSELENFFRRLEVRFQLQ